MAAPLLEVTDAQNIILDAVAPLAPVERGLGPDLLGQVLAEDAVSDLDSPPFDKAMMDGYAVRAADLASGEGTFTVVEEVLAGQVPRNAVGPGEAARIMTGAPVPIGADAVVMVERSEMVGTSVRLRDRVRTGQNVLPKAREMRVGEVIVSAGARLRPEEIGLLAAIGHSRIRVHPRPEVALVPTGDELVAIEETPGPGQIRNTNGHLLLAQIARAGGVPNWIGVARDTEPHLRETIAAGLQKDMLVLSGGVSAGKADLVPKVLADLGVESLLHRVRMKPGKPMYFGRKPNGDRPPTYVFGLPGNPVSSLVCFELFVRPAIRRAMDLVPGPQWIQVPLSTPWSIKTDRPTFHPANLEEGPRGRTVRTVPWFGSPDLRGVATGNAFVLVEAGDHTLTAGQMMPVLCVDH